MLSGHVPAAHPRSMKVSVLDAILQTTVSQWFTSLTQNIFRAGTPKHLAHSRK
jgi:hypothetical protein